MKSIIAFFRHLAYGIWHIMFKNIFSHFNVAYFVFFTISFKVSDFYALNNLFGVMQWRTSLNTTM